MLKKIRIKKLPVEGEVVLVYDGIRQYGVRKVEGRYYISSNRCPHAGARLDAGSIVKVKDRCMLRCPRHGWLFDLETGASPKHKLYQLQVFELCEDAQGHYFEVEEVI